MGKRKKPKIKEALPTPIYPEYYGADAYRSDVFPQDIQANPGTELLSPEIIHDVCRQEAKKTAYFGLLPRRKNKNLWQQGMTKSDSEAYAWNHERVTIAAVP